jgi:hypothetical protein
MRSRTLIALFDTVILLGNYFLFLYSMENMFWCQYQRSQHYATIKAIEQILKKLRAI